LPEAEKRLDRCQRQLSDFYASSGIGKGGQRRIFSGKRVLMIKD